MNKSKNVFLKKFLVSLTGIVILGFGVAVFKLSNMGCDPFNGMNMAVSENLPITYANYHVIISLVFFAIQIIWARHMIGISTIIDALLSGYITTFFYNVFLRIYIPNNMISQIILMFFGVAICSLGLAMYLSSYSGASPYDSLPFILNKHFPKVPYVCCRVFVDGMSAVICILAGGIGYHYFGVGTLVCALGVGPMVQFYNNIFFKKIIEEFKE